MRIFIAGGTGVIGRQLVPLLVRQGHDVVVGTRRPDHLPALRDAGADGAVMDVFDAESVAAAVAGASPEVVVHQLTSLAGGDPAANARIRAEGTRNLVGAAKRAGVRRIVAQSISWAYEPGPGPAAEDTPLDIGAPAPRSVTVGGVRALESAVAEIDEYVILRYGTFYGPGTWYAPGGFVAGALAKGTVAANDAVSSFVHVEDAAAAVPLALGWPSGAVNIVDDEPAPAHLWVPVLAGVLGAPAPARSEGGAAWERGAANAKARSLGWLPGHPTWRTGF
ncbi:NAD-dependent epimerase/dehydratase family protein [Streptomyces sp. CA-111067]|uniref:NAD-dependent epimerase/dehydratase family protein n=1 Tax=Streptomyces sp. CA-111067 TaxID=3240046 RepID=UPI003D96BFB3